MYVYVRLSNTHNFIRNRNPIHPRLLCEAKKIDYACTYSPTEGMSMKTRWLPRVPSPLFAQTVGTPTNQLQR